MNAKVYTLSAATAVICSDLVTTPMWVVRIRYQTEFMHSKLSVKESFNVINGIKKLYNKEGFFALYRGFGISLIGTPHIIIQFNLYENFKKIAHKYHNNDNNLDYNNPNQKSSQIPYRYILVASICSKSK